jgi:predicted nucleic acid-binding protein
VIVVDANLLVYLWVGGPSLELAEAVLHREPHWGAPFLWRSEFRNAVVGLVRARRRTLEQALAATRHAELQMAGHEYVVNSEPVVTAAMQSGCTAYDCEYVALAENLGLTLVTFDGQVQRAFPETAIAPEAFVRN